MVPPAPTTPPPLPAPWPLPHPPSPPVSDYSNAPSTSSHPSECHLLMPRGRASPRDRLPRSTVSDRSAGSGMSSSSNHIQVQLVDQSPLTLSPLQPQRSETRSYGSGSAPSEVADRDATAAQFVHSVRACAVNACIVLRLRSWHGTHRRPTPVSNPQYLSHTGAQTKCEASQMNAHE